MPNIRVSNETYKDLIKAKASLELQEEELVSFDELIRRMLAEFPKVTVTAELEKTQE